MTKVVLVMTFGTLLGLACGGALAWIAWTNGGGAFVDRALAVAANDGSLILPARWVRLSAQGGLLQLAVAGGVLGGYYGRRWAKGCSPRIGPALRREFERGSD